VSNSALANPWYQPSLGQPADPPGKAPSKAAGTAGAGGFLACNEQPTPRHPIRRQRTNAPDKNILSRYHGAEKCKTIINVKIEI
jgi:hypothetical protein